MSDSDGTSRLHDVSEPVNQGMSWRSCLPYTPYVNSMNAKVDSPLHLTLNEELEATRDVNYVFNNASAAHIKSLPCRALCLRILQRHDIDVVSSSSRWSARHKGRMGEGQKMDDSPPFEVHSRLISTRHYIP
ncbi:hypothetical protein K439DRAFT_168250 [Ramaria rubella]|nr:hypothetical protein K439DRAFT_168250 [Ramaria rubella]